MPKKIDSGNVIPKSNVSGVDVETPLDAKIRSYTRAGAAIAGFVIMMGGFALCAYIIINDKAQSAQAFSVISGMIGAVFGYLYGTRSSG